MNGPNKTVAAARNAKLSQMERTTCRTQEDAEIAADAMRAKGLLVRVTRFNLGPRSNPTRMFNITGFAKP